MSYYTFFLLFKESKFLPIYISPKNAGYVTNSLDPDQHCSSTSDLGLHCLLELVFSNISDRYGNSL